MSEVNGVVVGLVTSVDDPEQQGRVKVHFPWLDDGHETDWIRIATLMAGHDRGSFFMPEVDDEVLVAFEHGEARFPYVIGFLWNGRDKPPGANVRDRIFKSKNGHQIRFLDSTPGSGDEGGIILEDAHLNRITLTNGQIKIQAVGILVLEGASVIINVAGVPRIVAPTGNPI